MYAINSMLGVLLVWTSARLKNEAEVGMLTYADCKGLFLNHMSCISTTSKSLKKGSAKPNNCEKMTKQYVFFYSTYKIH